MERDDQLEALVRRNRLLVAEAAELRAHVQQRRVQLRAQQGSSLERRRQWHEVRELGKHARSAAADAAERRVISQNMRAQLAAMLNQRTAS